MAEEEEDIAPQELQFSDAVFNVEFHPSAPLVASALITGDVYLYVIFMCVCMATSSADDQQK
jgi:hypothetical protein